MDTTEIPTPQPACDGDPLASITEHWADLLGCAKSMCAVMRSFNSSIDIGYAPMGLGEQVWAELTTLSNLVDAARISITPSIIASGRWKAEGSKSPEDWLAGQSGSSTGKARSQLETGKNLRKAPGTQESFLNGEISAEQADAIADAVEANPAAEDDLLDQAKRDSLKNLKDEAARRKAEVEDIEERERRLHRKRYVRQWTDKEGAWNLRARGPLPTGSEFMAVLEGLIDQQFKKARKAGVRGTRDNYAYDALMDLANQHGWGTGAGGGTGGDTGGGKPGGSAPANGNSGGSGKSCGSGPANGNGGGTGGSGGGGRGGNAGTSPGSGGGADKSSGPTSNGRPTTSGPSNDPRTARPAQGGPTASSSAPGRSGSSTNSGTEGTASTASTAGKSSKITRPSPSGTGAVGAGTSSGGSETPGPSGDANAGVSGSATAGPASAGPVETASFGAVDTDTNGAGRGDVLSPTGTANSGDSAERSREGAVRPAADTLFDLEPAPPSKSMADRSTRSNRAPARQRIFCIDWTALVRGRPQPGERCEMRGSGPVSVATIRNALVTGTARMVITDSAGWVRTVALMGTGSINGRIFPTRLSGSAVGQLALATESDQELQPTAGQRSTVIIRVRAEDLQPRPENQRISDGSQFDGGEPGCAPTSCAPDGASPSGDPCRDERGSGCDDPVHIPGVGSVDRGRAIDLLGAEALRRLLERVIAVRDFTYAGRAPSAAQRVALAWADTTCKVPGCHNQRVEIDHRHPWAADRVTELDNLDPLCGHHHDLKTREGWAFTTADRPQFVPPNDPSHPGPLRTSGRRTGQAG